MLGIAWLDGRHTGGGHDHGGHGGGAMTLRAATFGSDGLPSSGGLAGSNFSGRRDTSPLT